MLTELGYYFCLIVMSAFVLIWSSVVYYQLKDIHEAVSGRVYWLIGDWANNLFKVFVRVFLLLVAITFIFTLIHGGHK